MITSGFNVGRIGTIYKKESHPGTKDIIHIKDDEGVTFASTINNIFVISTGKNSETWISVPRDKGIRKTIIQEQSSRGLEKYQFE
mmetsp:Transcript_51475/g.112334  ORF Transcript_51475/g.112334 Transcript_51475/m.112334 type:complete len:85 (+) Transcript_51475:586-840(+)